jgi:formylmethanofuran dehydrogenase subunit A
MTRTLIRGGHVIDPAHGVDAVQDIYLQDGRVVAPLPEVDETVDASGCIVMAGGIDMHTHIGGGKANLARMLLPEDHRGGSIDLPSCGTCTPGTLATGTRYVEMGYTAAFEPAMMAANARHTHMEMGDTPVLDHGAYVMLGNDELFLEMLARGEAFDAIRDYTGWQINAAKAMGVKVVNPAGISAFKFNQRKLDVDEAHTHWQVTPRQVVQTLARALRELGVPHPLHIHGSNLGVAGNIESTLQTIAALEGLPAHLTHIQFHAYGKEGPKKFSSGALQLAEVVNANANISLDVGQIMFGQTVTASGDTMRQYAQSGFATPRKWIGADYELEAGCGVVPFKYREQSFVNALQWAIGLEIFLLVNDPWRVVLTTDHPNGGPFTSYPHLIKLLMNRSFREEQLAKLHPDVAAGAALKHITRELTLSEIAIMTRAAPARLLGLRDRGHLGVGAAADVVLYRREDDMERMFSTPERVYKDGQLVAKAGTLVAAPVGGTHFVEPDYDHGIHKRLKRHFSDKGLVNFDHVAISHDELCRCCNGGRLLPTACFEGEAT